MSAIKNLLLYELRAIQLSPGILQTRLSSWEHDLTLDELVEELRQLHDDGLVDGPGISRLHHLPVWLTSRGQTQAREIGDQLGVWRRVA